MSRALEGTTVKGYNSTRYLKTFVRTFMSSSLSRWCRAPKIVSMAGVATAINTTLATTVAVWGSTNNEVSNHHGTGE